MEIFLLFLKLRITDIWDFNVMQSYNIFYIIGNTKIILLKIAASINIAGL